jgi:thioesterase domain-containing protein
VSPNSRPSGGNLLWRQPLAPDVEAAALRRAWRALAARHPAGATLAGLTVGVAEWPEDDPPLRDRLGELLRRQPFRPGDPPARALLTRTGRCAEVQLSAPASVDGPAVGDLLHRLAVGWRTAGDTAASTGEPATDEPATDDRAPGRAPGSGEDGMLLLRDGGGPHLHLFHPGGGGAMAYLGLSHLLPTGWRVTASEDMGRGDTVDDLVDRYLPPLLRAAKPPQAIGGWSLGAVLAVAAWHRLAEAGTAPLPRLVLLDPPPPGNDGSAGPVADGPGPVLAPGGRPERSELSLEFARILWYTLGLPSHLPTRLDCGNDLPAAVAALQAMVLCAGGPPTDAGLLKTQLDAFHRHRRALWSYPPPPYADATALIVTASTGPAGTPAAARWSDRLASATIRRVSCGHFELLQPPSVGLVADHITRWWTAGPATASPVPHDPPQPHDPPLALEEDRR